MSIKILMDNKEDFWLLYSAVKFKANRDVTGYFIYPDLTKSDVFTFDNLGDGIYAIRIQHQRKTNSNMEKHGLVVKENGVIRKFELISIQN